MKFVIILPLIVATVLPAWTYPNQELEAEEGTNPQQANVPATAPRSGVILSALDDPSLALLVTEVLERNPRLARLRAEALAADQRAPQVSALPDPVASLTLFLLAPQTRVGPQQATVNITQRLSWFGKLQLKEQTALFTAAAAWAGIDAAELQLITEARTLYHELGFLQKEEEIVREDQSILQHYEQLAQARYASGVGLGQSVVKIQAEITQADTRLLEIEKRRVSLKAELNSLRDQPQHTPLPTGSIPDTSAADLDAAGLRKQALTVRPEITAATALIESASSRTDLAKKQYKPDFNVGLNYGFVGKRDDTIGQQIPVEGDGDDILAISAGVNLPIWRKKLAAGVEEAAQLHLGAIENKRAIVTEIEATLGDLVHRIPLTEQQLRLFDDVLVVQAEQSLRSAEAAYASNTAGALDLLDAERTLLQVRIGAERMRADLATGIAELEGATAAPLSSIKRNGNTS